MNPNIWSKVSKDEFHPKRSWRRCQEKVQELPQTQLQERSKGRSAALSPPRCCWRLPTRRRGSGRWRRSWWTCRPWPCTSCRSTACCTRTTGRFPPIQHCPYHGRGWPAFCKIMFNQLIKDCFYLNWSIRLHISISLGLQTSHRVLQPTRFEILCLTQAWKLKPGSTLQRSWGRSSFSTSVKEIR